MNTPTPLQRECHNHHSFQFNRYNPWNRARGVLENAYRNLLLQHRNQLHSPTVQANDVDTSFQVGTKVSLLALRAPSNSHEL